MPSLWLLILLALGGVGWVVGISGWMLARQWARDCQKCRIIIARKGRVMLDASLVEWLSWNKALPKREQDRGGIIFHANGIQVALARPKIGAAAAKTTTQKVKEKPARRSPTEPAAGGIGPAGAARRASE